MTGLAIYMSNRTEILAEQLAGVLRAPQGSALVPEIIVVQSRGMQRWLSLRLARHNGICANIDFPFPKAFLSDMAARLAPDLNQTAEDDPALMTFRLMRLLPDYLDHVDFKQLRNYLVDDHLGLKRFQLCQKIAFLFDQYRVYRPDRLHRWEQGLAESDPDGRWQAPLWRHLIQEAEPDRRMRWPQALTAAIDKHPRGSGRLPARAAIFGISYLPPLYLHQLTELSRIMRLNLFWMNPSREYWGDIVSERQAHRLQSRVGQADAELYLESGNRLLAAFGALGRNFMKMLIDCDSQIFEHYEKPSGDTLLSGLQADILDLRDRTGADASTVPAAGRQVMRPYAGADPSIQVHSCHSPLREMEILHDNLLALLEADPDLKPSDVIVMAPDIETYAPFVQAVFGTQTDPTATIPYSISDRSPHSANGMAAGFMALLDLRDSRFGAAGIVRLLEFTGIKERFGLDHSDLVQIERWVRESQIRWGRDAHSREREGLPGYKENTWSEGFRRMLLGYAMPTGERALFEGILPYDHIEGSDTVTLGNFMEFVTCLFELNTAMADPKPVAQWKSVLFDLLDQFFAVDADSQREFQLLRQTIVRLAECAAQAGFAEAVDLSLVRAWLQEQLEADGGATGFLGQGLTFCALLPMRSIPFEVVCLVGMDHTAFPRDSQPLNFDLMAEDPKAGDRSRRDDDRYLFLEAILSARKALYISYIGQNIQDNSTIPPSVVVRELMDALDPDGASDGVPLSAAITVRHRLQPFSSGYFKDNARLFSYSTANMVVCARACEPKSQTPFFPSPLALAAAEGLEWQRLDLKQLALFCCHPSRFLLQRRMGVYLDSDAAVVEDCERFNFEGLERYQLGDQLLRQRLEQTAPSDQHALLAASGLLPPANIGRMSYDQLIGEVDALANQLKGSPMQSDPTRIDIDFRCDDLRLCGGVPRAHRGGCVTVRFAKTKARDLLETWIYHLGYAIAAPHAQPVSYLFCRDRVWKFETANDSQAIMKDLLSLFRAGMRGPTAFVPQTAYAFADALLNRTQPEDAAWRSARTAWQGNEYVDGEAHDPYVALCYRQRDPLSEDFKELALQVYGPLFDHLEPVLPGTVRQEKNPSCPGSSSPTNLEKNHK